MIRMVERDHITDFRGSVLQKDNPLMACLLQKGKERKQESCKGHWVYPFPLEC